MLPESLRGRKRMSGWLKCQCWVLGVLLDDVLLRRGVYMCIGQLLLSCYSRLSGTDWQHRITGLRAPHLIIFFQRKLARRRSWKSEHPTIHRMIHFSTWKMFKASSSLQQPQSGQCVFFVVVAGFFTFSLLCRCFPEAQADCWTGI